LSESNFDRYFPTGSNADQFAIVSVLNQLLGFHAQLWIIPEKPQQRVHVEKQARHSMYSRKSSSGASKSGAIQCFASLALPATQGHRLGRARVSVANGSPSRTMTNCSPGFRPEIISGRWAFASSR